MSVQRLISRKIASVVAAVAVAGATLVSVAGPASAVETITVSPSTYTNATAPLEVTINGFPTMALNNYYVYWLDFTNMPVRIQVQRALPSH
ncbi:MAG: hypothetical protein PHN51_11015 [Candidatus Nanopelagicales bacterium]|nr:hypothetical protein [Candidatus Nanopelagicales bacterium]